MYNATSISSTTQSSAPHHRFEEKSGWHFGFWSLIVTQFQNAFNDNAIKFLVIYIIVAMNFPKDTRENLILVVGALFALPFIFFSMVGGNLADRYSKRSVVIGTKLMELFVMAVTILGLWLHNLPLECAAVFLISSQSALFGPSKYGLLPELVPERKLSWANGIIELGTFMGSIAAVMAAGALAERYHGREQIAGVILLGCTLLGLATSFGITRVPAADLTKKLQWNPIGDLGAQMKTILADRTLAWAVMGNSYLFFLAALLQFTIIIYGHDVLRVDETHISYLQAAVGIGIGIGSIAAGYLSGGKIEYGLIPLGALGMTVFGALLSFRAPAEIFSALLRGISAHVSSQLIVSLLRGAASWAHLRIFDLALLGIFGGLFAVPLGALIQHRPRREDKGGVIAAANLVSFIGIALASVAYYIFTHWFHQNAAGVFLDGAILTLVTSGYAIWLLPDSLVRFLLWAATMTLYRIRVDGRENVPESGGALFVCNHMSFVDGLLLIASIDRPIRFILYKAVYDLPYVRPFAKIIGAIPISSEQRPREMIHS